MTDETADNFHQLLLLIVQHVMEVDMELLAEPEEEVQSTDNIIGPVSMQVMCLWTLWHKMSAFNAQSFVSGIGKILEEVKEREDKGIEKKEGEMSEGQKLLARVRHPQHMALSLVAAELFRCAVVFDAMDGDLCDKEIDLRKGWIAVWTEKSLEKKK